MQMRPVRAALHILTVSLTLNLQNHLHSRTETKTFPHDLSCETRPQIMTMVKYCVLFLVIFFVLMFFKLWVEGEGSEQVLSIGRVSVAVVLCQPFNVITFILAVFLLEF